MNHLKIQQKPVTIDPLTVPIHPYVESLNVAPGQYFKDVVKMFREIRTVIVDKQGRVIFGLYDVLAAKEEGITSLDAIQVDLSEADTILFINLWLQVNKKDYHTRFRMIEFLKDYLLGIGKTFADQLPGDTDDKLGYMMECSPDTIRNIVFMGTHDPVAFDKIKNKEIGFTAAHEAVKKMVKETGKKVGCGGRPSNVTTTDVSSFPFDNASITLGKIGDIKISVAGADATVQVDGQVIPGTTYTSRDEIDRFGKTVGACRYIFLAADMKSSVQIIINNPNNLFK